MEIDEHRNFLLRNDFLEEAEAAKNFDFYKNQENYKKRQNKKCVVNNHESINLALGFVKIMLQFYIRNREFCIGTYKKIF